MAMCLDGAVSPLHCCRLSKRGCAHGIEAELDFSSSFSSSSSIFILFEDDDEKENEDELKLPPLRVPPSAFRIRLETPHAQQSTSTPASATSFPVPSDAM